MNHICAAVTEIKTNEQLTLLSCCSQEHTFTIMSLELDAELKVASKIILQCKETAIAIAKNFSGELSHTNQLKVTIKKITIGSLLCSLELLFENNSSLESIITAASAKKMNLAVGDDVIALIQAHDIAIQKSL